MRGPLADLKDISQEQALFGARLLALGGIVLLATALLVWRMIDLQIIDSSRYQAQARNNRVRVSPLPPPRGLIYDRNGILIAENQPSFSLELTPARIENLGNTIERLRHLLDIGEEDIQKFHKLRRSRSSHRSTPLVVGLTEEQVARFHVHRREFDGVEIQARTRRHYPYGELFAHVLGRVGRINARDQARVDIANYRGTERIGKTGIERYYEDDLHGTTGFRQDEVDVKGRLVRSLSRHPPTGGTSLVLTIDGPLQQAAIDAMGENTGAVVALDPRNGEVLALVSLPGYDPNPFINGISRGNYARLRDDTLRPLFNRAVQGQYPPGSTIKMLTALAGLEAGTTTATRRMFATGYYQIPNDPRKYRDWNRSGHGWIDLYDAIARSSDVYFYDLAYRTGIDRLEPMFRAFGLGHKTGIDLLGETAGLVPSRAWKQKRYQKHWFPGETLITAIGQGYMLASPLQLAEMTACLAMRGHCPRPHLLKAKIPAGEVPGNDEDHHIELKDPRHWDIIIEAMKRVVTDPHGTGRRIAKGLKWPVAGKTGTSQVFGLKEGEEYDAEALERHLRDHALFVGFAPADDPRIAVAVIVEHGGHGGVTAAPIARRVIDAWLERH